MRQQLYAYDLYGRRKCGEPPEVFEIAGEHDASTLSRCLSHDQRVGRLASTGLTEERARAPANRFVDRTHMSHRLDATVDIRVTASAANRLSDHDGRDGDMSLLLARHGEPSANGGRLHAPTR